jgi:hypothetical protein
MNNNTKARWEDEDKGAVLLGVKCHFQHYPCITAYTNDYALIASSKNAGKLVDTAGKTIATGDPVAIARKFDLDFIDEEDNNLWKFWQSKYPKLLQPPTFN